VSHHRRAHHADSAPAAVGPYSHAVVSGGLLFCSGQIALDSGGDGALVGDDDAGEQTRQCLRNLAAVCESAGAGLADAVRLTVYCTDLTGDWNAVNEAYAEFFGDDPPARAAIGVAALPKGARVEIDAVVALPE
jgi:2-iminobutanoate/2-iminopropanoate deaminase